MITFYDFLYFIVMMQGLGLAIGCFISMIFHWPEWN